MAATAPQIKIQTQPTKPKRRRFRETTISSSAAAAAVSDHSASPDSHQRRLDSPTVVSPDNSWCCPASKAKEMDSGPHFTSTLYGGGANGDSAAAVAAVSPFPTSFSKFNSALTAGLLNPMSPPLSVDKTRSSPTLFEMMANEPDCLSRSQIPAAAVAPRTQISPQDKQALAQQRLSDLLYCRSPGSLFNDTASSDTRLTLSSKDGLVISMNVHRQILVAHSRFFAGKLSDRWSKQQQQQPRSPNPYVVEISDCDDAELYIETLRLMYCKDLRKKLMREDVSRVLGILKVSAAIGFDAGVLSCLEYLEAAPWAEDEEEKVASLLSELRLEGVGAMEVLKRVSIDVTNVDDDGLHDNEGVLLKLLHVVLEGKDEKARREMKGLVLKMLRENSSQNDLKKESLYSAVDSCLQSLRRHLSRQVDVAKIAREADNLHWILEILIDRQIAEDFLKIWVLQGEIAEFHSKVALVHRFEISRVTARLFVGIGKGQLLASKDDRCKLLRIWLVPFYDDFGWMRRANSKGVDRHLIEDGLSNTILTLPLVWQQEFFMSWFDRFLNAADDCPNIQRGFEVWWRRAFWRRNGEPDRPLPQQMMRISTPSIQK